jgi:hypothetical protein
MKEHGSSHAGHDAPDSVFHDMFMALSDMQDAYFQRWLGTWPHGNDWTRAVMNTHVVAALRAISDELELSQPDDGVPRKEEVISGYFSDVLAYYFGEDAFSIRNQAYDDMLWVVLGWLESIQFIDEHGQHLSRMASAGLETGPGAETWYGNRWIPAFAHRARIFWELAAKGWDTKLCGGGMLWNPRLMPYKNAITNQLFISASINMYLHFPGDPNTSPFSTSPASDANHANHPHPTAEWQPRDPRFALAAQEAHAWLSTSNMTNAHGLYADGFHISGHPSPGSSNNTKCDQRDEMVYTYNQGVLLSGLAGLYRATGRESYLREGHALIHNVIRATGWDLRRQKPVDDDDFRVLPPWHGLGRLGVLEDACDVSGTCSQDAQTFKGVWMHHFAGFCAPGALGRRPSFVRSEAAAAAATGRDAGVDDDDDDDEASSSGTAARHRAECRRYIPWLAHNARAAMATRDGGGLFGMWWTVGLLRLTRAEMDELAQDVAAPMPAGGEVVDYRNWGVPQDEVWVRVVEEELSRPGSEEASRSGSRSGSGDLGQKPVGMNDGLRERKKESVPQKRGPDSAGQGAWDPNLRGRGRTVETQGGGLALLRALWVVSRLDV